MTPLTAGLLLVDKPSGPTSHDVVGRARRVLGTRKVGHAGTLDPMASGLLILGVERGTKLLGHLALSDKTYLATIRLGVSTTTEDAQGSVTATANATSLDTSDIQQAVATLTGEMLQVPSAVSAIKVDGRRAYQRVRAGEDFSLPARPVTVHEFTVLEIRCDVSADPNPGSPGAVDLDVRVSCSTGTYIRALARDLGDNLGVGAHLTALRRITSGPFGITDAVDLWADGLDARQAVLPATAAAARVFAVRTADPDEARDLSYGRPLHPIGIAGTYAVLDESGAELLALMVETDGRAKPVLVWHAAGSG
jgi:tRNA pseudouridine55 synthase